MKTCAVMCAVLLGFGAVVGLTAAPALALAYGYVEGTVTDGNGEPVAGAVIAVYLDGRYTAGGVSGTTGRYDVNSVPVGTNAVACFVDTVDDSTSFLPQCWSEQPWTGHLPVPPGATSISVRSRQFTRGIDFALSPGGAITGKVTAAGIAGTLNGSGLVTVVAFDVGTGVEVGTTDTGLSGGYYRIDGLPDGDYVVCAEGGGIPATAVHPYGYGGSCLGGKRWTVVQQRAEQDPSAVTSIPVAVGEAHIAPTLIMPGAAAISGTITEQGGAPLSNVRVSVFDASGRYDVPPATAYDQQHTDADGHYLLPRLDPSPGGLTVCFDSVSATNQQITGGTSNGGYVAQCSRNVFWPQGDELTPGSPPSGAAAVETVVDQVASGLDATLTRGGGFAGFASSGGENPRVDTIVVDAFGPDGQLAGQAAETAHSYYTLKGLPASSAGYVLCVEDVVCYPNVPWDGGALPVAALRLPVHTNVVTHGVDIAP